MTDKPDEEMLQQDGINSFGIAEEITLTEGTQHIQGSELVQDTCDPVIEICIESNNEHQEIVLQHELNLADCHGEERLENANESEITNEDKQNEANNVYEANSNVEIATEVQELFDILQDKQVNDEAEDVTNKANITERNEVTVCKSNSNMAAEVQNTERLQQSDNEASSSQKETQNKTEQNGNKTEIAIEVQKMFESLQDEVQESTQKDIVMQNPTSKPTNVDEEKVFQLFQVIGQEQIIVDLSSLSKSKKKKEKKCKKKSGSSSTKKVHNSVPLPQTVQCSFCVKKFNTDELKDLHEKFHTEERPCKCAYCEKRFTTVGGQQRHERKFHTGEKLLKCTFCEKTFATATAIRRHERVHTDDRPFKCDQCEATFKDSTDLRRHERRHTGEKPFKCKICNRAFTVRSAMNRHQRVHTGAKPYLCDQCGQAFTDRFSLKQHIKGHSRGKVYKCGICDKGFSFRYHLHTHRRECGNNLTIEDVESKVSASLVAEKETGTAYLQLTESIVGSQMVYYLNRPISVNDESSN